MTNRCFQDNKKCIIKLNNNWKEVYDIYMLWHAAECNMGNIFRVNFVSIIFYEPHVSEI